MGMIKKQVTGSAESMKAVKNAKSASKSPMGKTGRTSFKGSNDKRPAGSIGPNAVLKTSAGYADQAPTMMGDTSHSRSFTKEGARKGITGKVAVAKESVTGGMGGKFIGKKR